MLRQPLAFGAYLLLALPSLVSAAEPVDPVTFQQAGILGAWEAYGKVLTFGKGQTLALVDGFKDFGVHVTNRLLGGIGMGGILATGALGFAKLMDTGIEAAQKRRPGDARVAELLMELRANGAPGKH